LRDRLRGAAVLLLFAALTVLMTWPQARHLDSRVYDADDPLLSIWRISWIAHALPSQPLDLLNGNIFYPEKRTLGYSDAVLLQGLAGAPLLWLGVSKVAVYNVLLLASIALSGWAMWKYGLHLTGNGAAAIVGGIVFAFVPYRFDHLHHLELQATFCLPLTLLYVDRAVAHRSSRDAWLAMASFVGQVYSCVYYSVFLATALVPIVAWKVWRLAPEARRAFLRVMAAPVMAAAAITLPYLMVYAINRETLGERPNSEVRLYSATLWNYLAAPESNIIHGSRSGRFGAPERLLFPGAVALVLAGIGLVARGRRAMVVITVGMVGLVISLGLNTVFYEPLQSTIVVYRGLRAPARASILVFLAVAALAAFGWERLVRHQSRRVALIVSIVGAAMLVCEYRNRLEAFLTLPDRPAEVYQWLAMQPRSVVVEVPFARPDRLHAIADGLYMFNSTWHWQPLVNGYSGFFPRSFQELAERMTTFPDDQSIEYLKRRGAQLIVVHGALMTPEEFGDMTATLLARRDLQALARFEERMGSDVVFRLLPQSHR